MASANYGLLYGGLSRDWASEVSRGQAPRQGTPFAHGLLCGFAGTYMIEEMQLMKND